MYSTKGEHNHLKRSTKNLEVPGALDVPKIPKAIRIYWRLMIWLNIFKNVRGIHLKMQFGLFLSSFIDILLMIAGSSAATLPKVYFSGTVYLSPYSAYFYVRELSDDLYSIMPGREYDVNDLILNYLKRGDVFIDVGANVGYYSVLAGKIVGDLGQIISVEPTHSTAKVLRHNVQLNHLKNVRIIRKAAWCNNGLIRMRIPKGFFGMASVCSQNGVTDTLEVEAFPLDELSDVKTVDLLKIDAEGSEYTILQGAKEILKKAKYVVLEASDQKEDIICLLRHEGFMIRKLKFTTYILAQKNMVKKSSL
jgi:FkbM family methyltransferase